MNLREERMQAYAEFLDLVDDHRGRIINAGLDGKRSEELMEIMKEDSFAIGNAMINALPMDDPVLPLICTVMDAVAASISELLEKEAHDDAREN